MSKVVPDVIETGYRRSHADVRDMRYALVAPTSLHVPEVYDFEETHAALPTYDQGSEPACVGWTMAMLKTAQEFVETERTFTFDGSDIYQPIALPGGGAYIREGLRLLNHTGAIAREDEQHYTISAYAGIDPKNHDEVRNGLVNSGVLAIGMEVPRFFMQGGGKEFDTAGGGSDFDIVGGHAITAIAYDNDGVTLLNSWGAEWDLDGRIDVSWAFWDKYVGEVWTSVDMSNPEVKQKVERRRRLLASL